MSQGNCSSCGTVNSPAAAFCSNGSCGQMLAGVPPEGGNNYASPQPTNEPQHQMRQAPQQPLYAHAVCATCRAQTMPGQKICVSCGMPIKTDNPGQGFSIAGMVLGIVGLVFLILFWPLGLICAIVGFVLSLQGKKKTPLGVSSGMATAGIVTSSIVLGIAILVALIMVLFAGAIFSLCGAAPLMI